MTAQPAARGFRPPDAVAALAAKGRNGDTEMAHVTKGEIVVPKSVQTPEVKQTLARGFADKGLSVGRYMVGGMPGINPETGAEEFADPYPLPEGFRTLAQEIGGYQNPTLDQYNSVATRRDAFLSSASDQDKRAIYDTYYKGSLGNGAEYSADALSGAISRGDTDFRTRNAPAPPPEPPPPPGGGPSAGVPALPTPTPPPTGATLGPQNIAAPSPVPRPTGRPAPGPANVNLDESSASHLNTMLDSGSPLMERAKARAAGFSNARGLLNSSIAAGAGEAAMIDAATPFALQDAQVNAARNLSDQVFRQTQAMSEMEFDQAEYLQAIENASKAYLSDLQFRQAQGLAEQGFNFEDYLQAVRISAESNLSDQQFRQQGALQGRELESVERRAADDIAARERMLGRQLTAEEQAQIREIASRESIATEDANVRRFLGNLDATTRASLANIEDSRLRAIANMQIQGQDRNAAMTAVLNIERTYADQFVAIQNNPNIPADARTTMLTSLGRQRDAQMSIIEQTYDVDLDWPVTPA